MTENWKANGFPNKPSKSKQVKFENDSLPPSTWAKLDWLVPVWVLIGGGSRTWLTAAAVLLFFSYSLS